MQNTARGWSDLGAGPNSGCSRDFVAHFTFQQIRGMASKNSLLDQLIDRLSNCPWPTTSGSYIPFHPPTAEFPAARRKPLYTAEERYRRDATPWTLVQGVLAPIQFLVFMVSVGLVLTYLRTGDYYAAATASVVVKTLVLYAIMVTGAIWEKRVFGKYLFAPAFFWEDAVSMIVIALHTAYLVAVIGGYGTARERMIIALAAYATYAVNATQFILKLRTARLDVENPMRAERAA